MSSVLGVVVSQAGQSDPAVRIFISNHVSCIDHNVLSLLTTCSSPSLSCSPGFLCWARGFLELGAPGSRTQLQESLKHYLSQSGNPPLLLFPEEETTNGLVGLLCFSSWPFSLSDSVQPLTLQARRPLVSLAVAGAPWYVELFWTLFSLYTVYHVRWLPPVCRSPRESDEDFASRVQTLLARSLGVHGTSYTVADRAEYVKRRRKDPPPHNMQLPSSTSPATSRMAQRVKEVLPQVPLPVILRDLGECSGDITTAQSISVYRWNVSHCAGTRLMQPSLCADGPIRCLEAVSASCCGHGPGASEMPSFVLCVGHVMEV
ncbi:hypothetical protein GDO81_025604 [Engystomops pustulosus]|uniref:Phospholipid/glycerol acyltransferase domain-containing protein n=1 Tax=Engystomops pustulosus TaxID=76066 RepID=A0AAV6YI95_ENGPU|nr:hypothetical protein GDO81_025604 [Engystomops pustulosus]